MNYFKKLKEYWLISTIVLCGTVFAAIWILSVNPMEESRNLEIEQSSVENTKLEKEIETKPGNEEKSLMEGTSFTSKFGFIVYISGSNNDLKQASMYITLENNKNKYHKNVGIGQIIKINHANDNYSIEINNIRDNRVDFTIRKKA